MASFLIHIGIRAISQNPKSRRGGRRQWRRAAVELAKVLQNWPAAASAAVQNLIQVGLINRERLPVRKREAYRVFDYFWFEIFAHWDRMLVQIQDTLQDGIAPVGEDSAAGSRWNRTRRFFDYLHRELPLLVERWRRLESDCDDHEVRRPKKGVL